MIELLGEWTTKATFNLRDTSSLHGLLESLTRYINCCGESVGVTGCKICLELIGNCDFASHNAKADA
jgi:hypothetical protein